MIAHILAQNAACVKARKSKSDHRGIAALMVADENTKPEKCSRHKVSSVCFRGYYEARSRYPSSSDRSRSTTTGSPR